MWETLAQRSKIAVICVLFEGYTGERASKFTGERLQGPCYPSMGDGDRKIRVRKKITDMGKDSFVKETIKLWNQLSAEALATFPCKSHIFRKRVRKVFMNDEK